jgi:hypothetical protein
MTASLRSIAVSILVLAIAPGLHAGPREQAKRIHDRLAGVPPSPAVLDAMEQDIVGGNPLAAAFTAMDHPDFLRVTLKNFVTPWTNRESDVFAPLNDYTATVIGMVRDGVDFRRILYGDIIYVGAAALGLPAYSNTNNDHYEAMEAQGVDLRTGLEARTQSSVTGIPTSAAAGVWTTRAGSRAFFIDGTNRAQFRFTMKNHLCRDMEYVKDTTRPTDRIRKDVSRSPGGDSRIFLNNCVGCHSGMDPLAQAFAYYDFENQDDTGVNGFLLYNDVGMVDPDTGTRVDRKYHINEANFEYGYDTQDDSWVNYWREGPNQLLGWDSGLPGFGAGAASMGEELSHSQAFAQCQVQKVFKNVCLRAPVDSTDRAQVDAMVANFATSNYQLKQVFADAAVYCMGD